MKKLVLAALVSTAAVTAYANTDKVDAKFKSADANHDGSLDKTEFKATDKKADDAAFSKADADSDGKVTEEEFKKAHGEKPAAHK